MIVPLSRNIYLHYRTDRDLHHGVNGLNLRVSASKCEDYIWDFSRGWPPWSFVGSKRKKEKKEKKKKSWKWAPLLQSLWVDLRYPFSMNCGLTSCGTSICCKICTPWFYDFYGLQILIDDGTILCGLLVCLCRKLKTTYCISHVPGLYCNFSSLFFLKLYRSTGCTYFKPDLHQSIILSVWNPKLRLFFYLHRYIIFNVLFTS